MLSGNKHDVILLLILEPTCRKYSTLIGNRHWMTQNGINVSKDMNETMEEHEVKGQTAVLVAVDGKLEQ